LARLLTPTTCKPRPRLRKQRPFSANMPDKPALGWQ
jgi:hypothetical protein